MLFRSLVFPPFILNFGLFFSFSLEDFTSEHFLFHRVHKSPISPLLTARLRFFKSGITISGLGLRSGAPLAPHCSGRSSGRTSSDFSLTKSLATSSLLLCERILRMVSPVSSMWMRRPRASQQAQEPWKKKQT